ncbi:MAG TPA: tripartite tricarboxylate transporter substrate binding protein [Burkholderiales bacterium]
MVDELRRRLLLAGLGAPLAARAQGLSSRPVRIILGQTAATTPDVLARIIAPRMQEKWKQPFVVENRGGAGGAIGMDAVAKAPPDGHVITVTVNSTLTLPLFFKIDFDVLNSFSPLSHLAHNIFVLVVHPSVPAKNLGEFLDWAKREGANANYGSPGNGTHHHLIMESFKLRTGAKLTHIPYKGSAPAFADLMGGQIATMFVPLGTALTLGGSGKIRAIGGSARERSPLAPDLPSLHEQGVEGFNFTSWFSAWGPAGMAPDVVARYNGALREILSEPSVRETLGKHGVSVRLSTPEELDRINREDYETLAKLVKDAHIKGD